MLKRRDSGSAEEGKELPTEKKQTKYSVSIYVIILFAAVLVLILLSYFVQQRSINELSEKHGEFSIQALQNIEELQNKNLTLTEELEAKSDKIDSLTGELDAAKAESETQTAAAEKEKNKTTAMTKLLDLYMVVNSHADEETQKNALAEAEKYAQHLDGAYSELFISLRDELNQH